jgi:hypothetical protein
MARRPSPTPGSAARARERVQDRRSTCRLDGRMASPMVALSLVGPVMALDLPGKKERSPSGP